MKKRGVERLTILLLLIICLFACKKSEPGTATEEPGATSQEDTTIEASTGIIDLLPVSSTEAKETQPVSEIQSTGSEDDSVPHLVWAVRISIPEEVQTEVQKKVTDAGIDCVVEFVSIPDEVFETGTYREWLEEQKEENTVPDILPQGMWTHGSLDVADFVRDMFLPLNDYLESEAGHLVRENFSRLEWVRSTYGETIYAVPKRLRDSMIKDTYLYVNDSYIDDFAEIFDGTYQSLQRIREKNEGADLIIAFPHFAGNSLLAWMGCCDLFFSSYQTQTGSVVDLTKMNETKELLHAIYTDYSEGKLVNVSDAAELSEKTLAYTQRERVVGLDGYTEYVLSSDPLRSDFGGSYGILSTTSKKDLALQVYGICFSDPRIASLIYWQRDDAERWKKTTEELNSCDPGPLTGFVPRLSEEEKDLLREYNDDVYNVASMLKLNARGQLELDPDYLEFLDSFFENPKDYGTVFDTINAQLKQWTDSKTN